MAVRWYLRYGLSYRDLEELLAERGVEVDHVTLFRWVQRFTPLLVDAARPCRHGCAGAGADPGCRPRALDIRAKESTPQTRLGPTRALRYR